MRTSSRSLLIKPTGQGTFIEMQVRGFLMRKHIDAEEDGCWDSRSCIIEVQGLSDPHVMRLWLAVRSWLPTRQHPHHHDRNPSPSILVGLQTTFQCVNSPIRPLLQPIEPLQWDADPARARHELRTSFSPARKGDFPPTCWPRPPIYGGASRSHRQPKQVPEDDRTFSDNGTHPGALWADREWVNHSRPSLSRPACPSSFPSSSSMRLQWPSFFSRPSSTSCRNTSFPSESAYSLPVCSSVSYKGEGLMEGYVQIVKACS